MSHSPAPAQQHSPLPAHKPPTWGSWLKAHWMKASLMTTAALYGTHQILETNYEYRVGGGNDPGGYIVYLLTDTVRDAGWALNKTSESLSWIYASISGQPTLSARQDLVIFGIPPSLSHMGWDSPEPGSKLEAYKEEALYQVQQAFKVRETPGSPYYRAPHMVILVRDVFDKFSPDSKNNPPLLDIRTFAPGEMTVPPGHNQYFMDPVTRKASLTP